MPRHRAFTLLELAVVLIIFVVLAATVVPMFGRRRSSCGMNVSQLRGIHQSLVMYADNNGGYFAGLDASGADAGLSVEHRFQVLLEANYFTGEYAVSPIEAKPPWIIGAVTTANYSYAMLQIPMAGGRRDEWSVTLSADAIVLGDRNTGTPAQPTSIHSNQPRPKTGGIGDWLWTRRYGPGWSGQVVFNDNHTEYLETPVHDTTYSRSANLSDHLFQATADDDALLIHSGN